MITSPVTIALCLLLAGSLFATRSAWRDPNNWKIDPKRGQLAFNNWMEITLFLGLTAMLAGLLVFWIF